MEAPMPLRNIRSAEFVWLPSQPIDHGAWQETLWGGPLRRPGRENRWVHCRRTFDLPANATIESADMTITVDGRYRLWVNGDYVAQGPVRSTPRFQRADQLDLRRHLKPGRNLLSILVHTPGVDLAWYEAARGGWQPVFGDGGLYCDLRIAHSDGAATIASDEEWTIYESDAWKTDAPRSGWGQDFIEVVDGRRIDPSWLSADFDDSSWDRAAVMIANGSADDVASGWGRIRPFPFISKREIPLLHEEMVYPDAVRWIKWVAPRPDLDVDRRLYEEELSGDACDAVTSPDAMLVAGGAAATVFTKDGRDVSIMLSFEPYHSGYPCIDIEAKGGEIIEVAAGECLPGEFGGPLDPGQGLKRVDHLSCAHIFRYIARPGRQQFRKFEWTAIRALQITVRNAPAGVKIHDVSSLATHYPAGTAASFDCSDPALTRLWHIGRHTAQLCMHDAWEDCPGREKRQWIGDALVHLDIAAMAFGPSALPLDRQFLMHGEESQRPDGLIQMFTPGDNHVDGVIIPDFSLHWILGAEKYYLYSGDLDLVEAIFPAVQRALSWFEGHIGPSGLLRDIPYWHFIEWAHVGRDGESAPINILYSAALAAATKLADALSFERAAHRYAGLRDRIAAALDRHWNEERGLYVDEVDPVSARQGLRASQQANGLALLFGVVPPERIDRVVASITDRALLKMTAAPPIVPHGDDFDERSDIVAANTYFSHFVYDALAQSGRYGWVLNAIREYYDAMLRSGTTTLWESFDPAASLCHVFSATPLYQLSKHTLGIAPIEPGFRRFRAAPRFEGLDWASGTVATAGGAISVEWHKEGNAVSYRVEHPEILEREFEAPPGFAIVDRSEAPGSARYRLEPAGRS